MAADQVFEDIATFAKHLQNLHAIRRNGVLQRRKDKAARVALKRSDRDDLLRKTGSRCHICGGAIAGNDWQADHILAHSAGGTHSVENYLPAHALCNNYRWHYDSEEFQWILKLGVWMRTQIERENRIGLETGSNFCKHECKRASRRRSTADRAPASPV